MTEERKLAYDFFGLPYHKRYEFANQYNLTRLHECRLDNNQKTGIWFKKVKDSNLETTLKEFINNFKDSLGSP